MHKYVIFATLPYICQVWFFREKLSKKKGGKGGPKHNKERISIFCLLIFKRKNAFHIAFLSNICRTTLFCFCFIGSTWWFHQLYFKSNSTEFADTTLYNFVPITTQQSIEKTPTPCYQVHLQFCTNHYTCAICCLYAIVEHLQQNLGSRYSAKVYNLLTRTRQFNQHIK